MPGIRVKPPGVRHRSVQIRAWRDIQFRRMNYWTWPPNDASPLHAIEPWGRTLFVFNAYKTISPAAFFPRGGYPILPPDLGANGKGIKTETVLCIGDFARRPLMFLNIMDFQTLVSKFGQIKEQLRIFKDILNEERKSRGLIVDRETTIIDDIKEYEIRRQYLPIRSYGMQRVKKGEHNSWGMSKGENRLPKT